MTQILAIMGIVVLVGLAFENWLFGFERIVALRLKPVTEADLVLTKAEAAYNDLEKKHSSSASGNKDRREDLKSQLKSVDDHLAEENKTSHDEWSSISARATKFTKSALNQQQDKERKRHGDAIKPLQEQANKAYAQRS